MAIVDVSYYTCEYMGQEMDSYNFPAFEARAEDVICSMTRWKVNADTIASLTPLQQTLVKKAICAQVEYFALNGLESAVGNDGRGFTVGRVSVNSNGVESMRYKGAMANSISPLARMYLEQSGLLAPQVDVAPDMPLVGVWPLC